MALSRSPEFKLLEESMKKQESLINARSQEDELPQKLTAITDKPLHVKINDLTPIVEDDQVPLKSPNDTLLFREISVFSEVFEAFVAENYKELKGA